MAPASVRAQRPSGLVYAIPSSGRPLALVDRTLALVRRLSPSASVRVYVAQPEHSAYAAVLDGVAGVELHRGAIGMAPNRHAIFSDPELDGLHVVQVDDDLRGLVRLVLAGMTRAAARPRLVEVEAEPWRRVLENGWASLRTGLVCWGLYPVANAGWMKPRWRVGLVYLGGGLFGYQGDHQATWWRLGTDEKEDYERSVRAYLAGGCARCEYVSWRTSTRQGAGGMQGPTRTPEANEAAVRYLMGRYPGLVHAGGARRDGWAEVRLADKRPGRVPA